MTELASIAVAMNTSQTRTEMSLAMVKQNADFQRLTVETLFETLDAIPAAPPGMGTQVDEYA